VEFDGHQALAIARGFFRAVQESNYSVFACSILPKHVHAVVGRHEHLAEQVVAHLKGRATQELVAEGLHPFRSQKKPDGSIPSVWAARLWKVYLNTPDDLNRAIRYVQDNPLKDGKREQRWPFVTAV
jgi:REP element-mobilizing transposase RayT